MDLVEPAAAYFESYRSALREFEAHGMTGFWTHFGPADEPETYLETIRQYQHAAGVKAGMVPASIFWLVDNREFIGHVSIRHYLNEALERLGGHIGYAIRPSKQRQGYGSHILNLALPRMRQLGISDALVTCNSSNAASRKIIERSGGTLIDEIDVNGTPVLRFRLLL